MTTGIDTLRAKLHVLLAHASTILSEPTYFFAPGPDPRFHLGGLVRGWLDGTWMLRCPHCGGDACVFSSPTPAGEVRAALDSHDAPDDREHAVCFDCRSLCSGPPPGSPRGPSTGRNSPPRSTTPFGPLEWLRVHDVLGAPPLPQLIDLLEGGPARVWIHDARGHKAYCVDWSTRSLIAPLLLSQPAQPIAVTRPISMAPHLLPANDDPPLRLRLTGGLITDAHGTARYRWNRRRLEDAAGHTVLWVRRRIQGHYPLQLHEPRNTESPSAPRSPGDARHPHGPLRFIVHATHIQRPDGERLYTFEAQLPPALAILLAARHAGLSLRGRCHPDTSRALLPTPFSTARQGVFADFHENGALAFLAHYPPEAPPRWTLQLDELGNRAKATANPSGFAVEVHAAPQEQLTERGRFLTSVRALAESICAGGGV